MLDGRSAIENHEFVSQNGFPYRQLAHQFGVKAGACIFLLVYNKIFEMEFRGETFLHSVCRLASGISVNGSLKAV